MRFLRRLLKPEPRDMQVPAEAANLQRHAAELRRVVREAQRQLTQRRRYPGGASNE